MLTSADSTALLLVAESIIELHIAKILNKRTSKEWRLCRPCWFFGYLHRFHVVDVWKKISWCCSFMFHCSNRCHWSLYSYCQKRNVMVFGSSPDLSWSVFTLNRFGLNKMNLWCNCPVNAVHLHKLNAAICTLVHTK